MHAAREQVCSLTVYFDLLIAGKHLGVLFIGLVSWKVVWVAGAEVYMKSSQLRFEPATL